MNQLREFRKWSRETAYKRRLLCHFYIDKSEIQYYDKSDYAYFNLFSNSTDWVVKGTPDHGIKSQRGKRSQVPCLNCFEVDNEFSSSIKKLIKNANRKFEFGIIMNERVLKNIFDVQPVSTDWPTKMPPPNKCHHHDSPYNRKAIYPFNHCQVVRVEIPKSDLNELPIVAIPKKAIMGLLVKKGSSVEIKKLLKNKKMSVTVFPVL